MKRVALILSMAAAPAWAAPVCEMGGAEPVGIFEQAKQSFLHREFDDFVEVAAAIMPKKAADAVTQELQKLDGMLPEGFDSCQTIVQRRDAGGMVQEVITFNVRGKDFPISLYLQGTPVRGKMIVSYLSFHTTMSNVLEQLK